MFTLLKENQINASLPNEGSVSDAILITKEGSIRDIKINLQVTHPSSGNISVKVNAPSGKEVILANDENGELSSVYEGEALQAFIGEKAHGIWTLTAQNASDAEGTIESWGVEVDCEQYNNQTAEIFIPDVDSSDMLVSTQECRFDGRVTQASVEVEIEHPLIGDLVVSVASPDGKEVVLHDRAGGSQGHLKNQWANIEGLVGAQTKGVWQLKVKNFHTSGNGALKHWKVRFHYEAEDDLKVVEGIGPKIEELLKNAGIYSYIELATSSPTRIKEILSAAGDRFNMHDPTTWPRQASLAAQGKWDELNQLKDELDGGKEVA